MGRAGMERMMRCWKGKGGDALLKESEIGMGKRREGKGREGWAVGSRLVSISFRCEMI